MSEKTQETHDTGNQEEPSSRRHKTITVERNKDFHHTISGGPIRRRFLRNYFKKLDTPGMYIHRTTAINHYQNVHTDHFGKEPL